MVKAFLSHSSKDKFFVEKVAKLLGKEGCVYDEQSFSTGEEFKASIEKGLDASSIFVLFASQHALESIWVQFELEEEFSHRLHDFLKKRKSLVYLIDSTVQIEDLPPWLRQARVLPERSYKIIAHDIQYHRSELLREKRHEYYFGRQNEKLELEDVLVPVDGSSAPRAVVVKGLPGVGRRTLIRKEVPGILNLKKPVEIRIEKDFTTKNICMIISERVNPPITEGFKRFTQEIENLSDPEATQKILNNLRRMVNVGELPLFIDEGGFINSEGYLREPIQSILQGLEANDTAYLFFITTRKPKPSPNLFLPCVSVGPLQEREIIRLISKLAGERDKTKKMTPEQIAELAIYVSGYPPAAHFAIEQANRWGVELLMSNKAPLVQFRTGLFARHLSALKLSDEAQKLLRLLAAHSPLPPSVLLEVLGMMPEGLQDVIDQLLDLALLTVTQEGYISIADPLFGAAEQAFGLLSEQEHKVLALALSNLLDTDLEEEQITYPRLGLYRSLFRAALLARDHEIASHTFHFASDVIQLTERLYHLRKFDEAIAAGYIAIQEEPRSETGRAYLIRALAQKERWTEAEKMLKIFDTYAPKREVYFLRGFVERRHGRISEAIKLYIESEHYGKSGIAINRELAWCHYRLGDLNRANEYIQKALAIDPNNSWLIDLQVQIATSRRDFSLANEMLRRLALFGSQSFYYHHRASMVALTFNNLVKARYEAEQAVLTAGNHPPFHIIAHRVYCEIELKTDIAETLLLNLNQQFKDTHSDIRIGLRCRFEISQGRYGKALSLSEAIQEKNTFSYKKIRYDALVGEINSSVLPDNVGLAYEDEITELEKVLLIARPEELIPTELDAYEVEAELNSSMADEEGS